MKETKSNWTCVSKYMKECPPIVLGKYASYWFYRSPRRMLHSLSYYKFAAKLIGKNRRVLDVGCNEGLGTWVLSKECGYAKGLDFDKEAIGIAKSNFSNDAVDFTTEDILSNKDFEKWDAIVNFDVIEHIYSSDIDMFFNQIKEKMKKEGLFILGTPSLISQRFASEISKKGHVNIYSPERLEEEMKKHFKFVFLFAANDEVVHTGFLPLAHYLIAVGCKKI